MLYSKKRIAKFIKRFCSFDNCISHKQRYSFMFLLVRTSKEIWFPEKENVIFNFLIWYIKANIDTRAQARDSRDLFQHWLRLNIGTVTFLKREHYTDVPCKMLWGLKTARHCYCITKRQAINFSEDTRAHLPLPNNLNLIYEWFASCEMEINLNEKSWKQVEVAWLRLLPKPILLFL